MMSLADQAARLHAAGVAANEDSRPDLAVRQFRAGLRLVGGDPAGTDPVLAEIRGRLLVSLAWAESERGRVDVGFRLLDEAEPLVPAGQRPILVAQRALLLERAGRYDLALAQYDEAVALLDEQTHPLDLVKALNNRGILHEAAGHIRLARADLRRCGQIAARHGMTLVSAICRTNLGCLAVLAGDLPSALRAFGTARREYETLAPGRLPSLAVERARALVAAGLFAEADRELAAAAVQAQSQRLGYTYADALLVRAEAALIAGRAESAAAWARQGRAQFLGRANARRAAFASLLELRAEYAAGLDDAQRGAVAVRAQALAARLGRLGLPEDARVAGLLAARALLTAGRLRHAERLADRHGPPGRADRLDSRLLWRLTRAELAAAAGRRSEASRHLIAGMTTLHRHRTQLGCLDLQTGAAVHGRDLARAGLAAALASGSVAEVYRWSERARAQALLLPPVRPPDNPAAATALEELRQVRHALRQAELAGRPAGGIRARAESLQRTVREHSWAAPGRGSAGGPTLAPFAAARAELADAALVIYLRADEALWALVAVDRSAVLVQLDGYAAAEEAVLRLRADLDLQASWTMPRRLAGAVSAATRNDARTLAGALLDPILPHVGDRDLVVVPTGILVTVPWSVLPGCAGRPVTVTPSATAWLASRRQLHARPPHRDAPTLLVAGPRNERGDAEIRSIAAFRPHATVLVGAAATPAATLGALDGVTVAHLAAHGQHQSENALFSSLELAGGPLMGYDLQQLRATPSMVVLSSCDLGLADVRPGDETFGLATVLLNAGAGTVVASVSRVPDGAAMAIMAGYHGAIAAGQPPAAALAGTLQGHSPAGFICLGAGRP
jgi:tetratricopeptide (TPR) repeat protein